MTFELFLCSLGITCCLLESVKRACTVLCDVSDAQDNDLNIRIYCDEQDDVHNETWQVVVT